MYKPLYILSNKPDNHVDEMFLHQLKKNINVPCFKYSELVYATCPLIQHLSCILVFLNVYSMVKAGVMKTRELCFLSNILTLGGYASWIYWIKRSAELFDNIIKNEKSKSKQYESKEKNQVKAAMIFLMVLLGLSPVLKTLTVDYSYDTICTMTLVLFLVNICCSDYSGKYYTSNTAGHRGQVIDIINPVALNAAMVASVLLASRLDNNLQVYGLMVGSGNWFALFPVTRAAIRMRFGLIGDLLLTLGLVLLCVIFNYKHKLVLSVYTAITLFITIVSPWWFSKLQRFKNNIHGPWDEAKLQQSFKK